MQVIPLKTYTHAAAADWIGRLMWAVVSKGSTWWVYQSSNGRFIGLMESNYSLQNCFEKDVSASINPV